MPLGTIGDPLPLPALKSGNSSLNWINGDTSQNGLVAPFIGEIEELSRPNHTYLY